MSYNQFKSNEKFRAINLESEKKSDESRICIENKEDYGKINTVSSVVHEANMPKNNHVTIIENEEGDSYVQDKLILSVIATLFCAFIGLFSMLKNFESRIQLEKGNIKRAHKLAATAKKIAGFAIGFGILVILAAIILLIVYGPFLRS